MYDVHHSASEVFYLLVYKPAELQRYLISNFWLPKLCAPCQLIVVYCLAIKGPWWTIIKHYLTLLIIDLLCVINKQFDQLTTYHLMDQFRIMT